MAPHYFQKVPPPRTLIQPHHREKVNRKRKIGYLEKLDKEQFAEQNLQSTIYNLQCRRMQAYACDKRSRNH
ncbi:MAG: hypothetical protein IJY72_10365, partial [Akkermansia sp.]|nr:hypothetical protein [Akkermansia sp.]